MGHCDPQLFELSSLSSSLADWMPAEMGFLEVLASVIIVENNKSFFGQVFSTNF